MSGNLDSILVKKEEDCVNLDPSQEFQRENERTEEVQEWIDYVGSVFNQLRSGQLGNISVKEEDDDEEEDEQNKIEWTVNYINHCRQIWKNQTTSSPISQPSTPPSTPQYSPASPIFLSNATFDQLVDAVESKLESASFQENEFDKLSDMVNKRRKRAKCEGISSDQ